MSENRKFKIQPLTPAASLYYPMNKRTLRGNVREAYTQLKRAVSRIAGGYTERREFGGWVLDSGVLAEEEVRILEVRVSGNSTAEAAAQLDEAFNSFARVLLDAGEEAVLIGLPNGQAVLARYADEGDK